MANAADFNEEIPSQVGRSTFKTIGLCVVGWLVGYLISAISSVLFFTVGHIPPEKPASTTGASFCRKFALGIGAAIALTIGAAALTSWYLTPDHAHWTHLIAILLMAPAAQFGALFRRADY
jgi:hypothetical protein